MLKSPSLFSALFSANDFMENHTSQPSHSPTYGQQTSARKEAGPGARLRQLWQSICQTPPWFIRITSDVQAQLHLELYHEQKGLIRRWQGSHAKLLIQHPCVHHLLQHKTCRHLQKHQVSQLLMTAAATELMLNRLSTSTASY